MMMMCRQRQQAWLPSLALSVLFFIQLGNASDAFSIQPKSWNYKGHFIGYETASSEKKQTTTTTNEEEEEDEPILLLNGFGVGSFHQHRLIPEILSQQQQQQQTIYAIDYLGQGRSWPIDCDDGNSENEKGLIYSADTWIDQLMHFIDDVILPAHKGKKIHIVGNSVGGYLSVFLATRRPDLVASLCLLNATPVWGLNLPGWSGHLPPPFIPRKIGRYLFDRIRDLTTIQRYLEAAYSNPKAFNEELVHQIRGCTEGKGGHAAFASILWSPPATSQASNNFYSTLQLVSCDVLLVFGKDDPWCTPAFAKKMLDALTQRNSSGACCRYVQLDNVGHCPNHEAPKAVGSIVSAWLGGGATNDRASRALLLGEGSKETFREEWSDICAHEMDRNDIKVGLLDKLAATFV